jgi:hypothetical protein
MYVTFTLQFFSILALVFCHAGNASARKSFFKLSSAQVTRFCQDTNSTKTIKTKNTLNKKHSKHKISRSEIVNDLASTLLRTCLPTELSSKVVFRLQN